MKIATIWYKAIKTFDGKHMHRQSQLFYYNLQENMSGNIFIIVSVLWNTFLVVNCFTTCPNDNHRYLDQQNVFSIENYSYGFLSKDKIEGLEIALPSLKSLIIRNDSIKFMEPKLFERLPNLICLDLSGNDLSTFNASTFFGLSRLKTLILSGNQLIELENDPPPFLYLDNLEKLDLSYNKIKTLHVNSFKGLINLKSLNLQNNQLKAISRLFYHLSNLLHLTLSNNPLEELDVTEIESLSTLSIVSANLRSLPNIPSKLKIFDLQRNQISVINDDEIRRLSTVEKIYFKDNRWKCNCELFNFSIWLNFTESVIDKDQLQCIEPAHTMKYSVSSMDRNCSKNETRQIPPRYIINNKIVPGNTFVDVQTSPTNNEKLLIVDKFIDPSNLAGMKCEMERKHVKYLLYSIPIGLVIGVCLSLTWNLSKKMYRKCVMRRETTNSLSISVDANI